MTHGTTIAWIRLYQKFNGYHRKKEKVPSGDCCNLIVEAQLELNIKCMVEKLMERFKLLFIALSEQSPLITAVQQAVNVVENEDCLYQHALLAFIPMWDIESAERRQVRHPLQAGISRDSLISECELHLNQAFYSTLLYTLYLTKVDEIPSTRSLLIHALFATNPTIKLPKGAGAFLSTCKQLLGNTELSICQNGWRPITITKYQLVTATTNDKQQGEKNSEEVMEERESF
ncbi:hypothetical protein QOT17_003737 [Balamuthia mandrillaris]